jgi:general transcription factor 3C polypeptide 3 (transcription factor C subunit 4)
LLASLASGLRTTDSFITSTLQKHLLRELKINDTVVKNPDALRWVPTNRRYAVTGTKGGAEGEDAPEDEDDGLPEEGSVTSTEKPNVPRMPTKYNPITLTVYGQMCASAKSYQSAIFYLLHAYDYSPDDPVICLSLAIASIGRAMQRQSDNRHHLVTQGMAFLSRYRTLRRSSLEGIDEIEFNFGRAFQQLGLYSHAAQHYERVLELAEGKPSDDPGLAREAAYNLGQIYIMTGAIPLAQAIYRRWLSL